MLFVESWKSSQVSQHIGLRSHSFTKHERAWWITNESLHENVFLDKSAFEFEMTSRSDSWRNVFVYTRNKRWGAAPNKANLAIYESPSRRTNISDTLSIFRVVNLHISREQACERSIRAMKNCFGQFAHTNPRDGAALIAASLRKVFRRARSAECV